MISSAPHYLLLADAEADADTGRWHFELQEDNGHRRLSAADSEPDMTGERLELLSVVRGLEAIDQPSRVTLLTQSRYVRRVLSVGLDEWRENDWCWEHYGSWVPVKHRDLWQRVDTAMKYHQVECRTWRVDRPHGGAEGENRLNNEHSPRLTAAGRRRRTFFQR